jgi:tagatose-6-phosphate ketose/aldose isomerase
MAAFHHTIQEICQQPPTWRETGCQMSELGSYIAEAVAGISRIVLTGSGSSQYAGECVAAGCAETWGKPSRCVAAANCCCVRMPLRRVSPRW